MKRRSFLQAATATSLLPLTLNGMQFRSHQGGALLPLLGKRSLKSRVLVVIQLNGGNDGLNTVVPLDQYENLTRARSNVVLQENAVLKLKNQTKMGLHPKMLGAQRLFDQDKMSIVQSVGYPQPDFSHFRSMDIWMSASHSHQVLTSGWLGRYLDRAYPKFPEGYPNDNMKDPLSLQIGPLVSLAFMGPTVNMGMALTNPSTFYNLMDNAVGDVPKNPSGDELAYIRLLAQQTNEYSSVIKEAALKGSNKSNKYPTGTRSGDLSEQLKIVARLISGGLKTPVYMVSMGGFDTHSEQVNAGDTKEGAHANLLSQLSVAMEAFQDDLQLLGISDRVVSMTFSEFGRRVQSNSSTGTDHGAAAPLFVFGDAVQPGVIGNNPSIPSKTTVNDNVPMQFDFRQVYASVLQDWFELSASDIKGILGEDFNTLPIFKNNLAQLEVFADYMTQIAISNVFPNPAHDASRISYRTDGGGKLKLNLFDAMGNKVHEFFHKNHAPGDYEYEMDLRGLRPGNYFVQLNSSIKSASFALMVH